MNHNRFRKQNTKKDLPKEEFALILDIIENDSNNSFKKDRTVQAIGFLKYTLLELVPKHDAILKVGQKVYIGEDKRDEIQYIKRIIDVDKLSSSSKSELVFTIEDIVEEKEKDFVNFFNFGGPISIRKHSFELIPRIGKKHLKDLLEERNNGEFTSFKNIEERCPYLNDLIKAISQRILEEIEGEDDFKFFTRK